MIPKHREIINKNDISNKKIKALVLGDANEGPGLRFNNDLWNLVKRKLEKDGYQITETVVKNPNYDKEIMNFSKNGYDIVIGFISTLHKRTKFGNFTSPIILDNIIIGFEPVNAFQNTFLYKTFINVMLIIVFFLVLTIILGSLLLFFGGHYAKKSNRIKWHFWGVISALLGEPGSIVENINIKNTYGLFTALIILLFMFISSLLFEATLTTRVVEDEIESEKDPIGTDIKGEKFFVQNGTSFVDALKNEGAIPIEVDIPYSKIQDYYLKNKSKASGFITDMATWGELKQSNKYNTLMKSQFQFPYDEAAWIVESNNYVLLDKVQQLLRGFHDDKTIKKLCTKHMPYMPLINCGI